MRIVYLISSLVWLFEVCLARKKLHIPYDVLSTDATGWKTIEKSSIVLKNAKIFPTDRHLMKRIALVEATLNRSTTEGGLWNMPTRALYDVTQNRRKYGKPLKKIHKAVRRKFGVTWSRMTPEQLRRPIYSLIAARMYLHMMLLNDIPRGAKAQGKVWSRYYHNYGTTNVRERNRLTSIFKKGNCFFIYLNSVRTSVSRMLSVCLILPGMSVVIFLEIL